MKVAGIVLAIAVLGSAVSLQGVLVPPGPPPANQQSSNQHVWQGLVDSGTGKIYYWNTVTQQTTWERPADFPAVVIPPAPPLAAVAAPVLDPSVLTTLRATPGPQTTHKSKPVKVISLASENSGETSSTETSSTESSKEVAHVVGCNCPGSACCRGAREASPAEIKIKRTPGQPCDYFTSCDKCMELSWCQWSLTHKNCSHTTNSHSLYVTSAAECGVESMPQVAQLVVPSNTIKKEESSYPEVGSEEAATLQSPIISNSAFNLQDVQLANDPFLHTQPRP